MKTCSHCGIQVDDNVTTCPSCGYLIATVREQQAPPAYSERAGGKFCSHCGRQINIAAVVCPYCGCPVETAAPAQDRPSESNSMGIASIILAFLMPLVGLILGIVGLKNSADPRNVKNCKIGIGISIGMMVVSIVFAIIMFSAVFSEFYYI